MTRYELIQSILGKQSHLSIKEVESSVKFVLANLATALSSGKRIEIRGFGSFYSKIRLPRLARNPKTGEQVKTEIKYVAHFRTGKMLRERINKNLLTHPLFNVST